MKVGFIGERYNKISFSMLRELTTCPKISVVWFIDSEPSKILKDKLYGKTPSYGYLRDLLFDSHHQVKSLFSTIDCKEYCSKNNIRYIIPKGRSINDGLPNTMYSNPEVDYVLIAGCDQILDSHGLQIAKNAIINYHPSPLPAYRGKNVVFWQWFNKEPYIGYTFHKVDLGVDTGEIVFQGCVEYNPDNLHLGEIVNEVIMESSKNLCNTFKLLGNDEKNILRVHKESSFYPSKLYLDLITVNNNKTVEEVKDLFKHIGFIRLENGLYIQKNLSSNPTVIDRYSMDWGGIYIPLSNGHIVGSPSTRFPFWIFRLILGERLIHGLQENQT